MNKYRFFFVLTLIVSLVLCVGFGFSWYMGKPKNDDAFFERVILAFEKSDKQAFPKPSGIVFTGSSSIRSWKTLANDMAPLPVISRGFGGAHMSHILYNFDRIITPYNPKAVVIFVGGNDIAAGKGVQRLISNYQAFIEKLRKELPDTDLWILGMKPSERRWKLWGKMQIVDEAFKALSAANEKVTFVDSGKVLLGSDGRLDAVYASDGLHLNAKGYHRWSNVLKPLLLERYD